MNGLSIVLCVAVLACATLTVAYDIAVVLVFITKKDATARQKRVSQIIDYGVGGLYGTCVVYVVTAILPGVPWTLLTAWPFLVAYATGALALILSVCNEAMAD